MAGGQGKTHRHAEYDSEKEACGFCQGRGTVPLGTNLNTGAGIFAAMLMSASGGALLLSVIVRGC